MVAIEEGKKELADYFEKEIDALEKRKLDRKKNDEMVDDRIFTGDVYNAYQEICEKTKNDVLTQRRVGDIFCSI